MCIKYLLTLFLYSMVAGTSERHSISKRALLFTKSTVVQFSTGLTVPIVLPRRSINLSLVAQVNYNMPYNLSNFKPLTISAREREKTLFFDVSRSAFYEYIIKFLDSFGLDGEQCLLRSICEISDFPMHIKDEETLLEKIVHFVFTPSLETYGSAGNETKNNNSTLLHKFLLAEKQGMTDGDCFKIYSDCIISIVDLFTNKYFIE